LGSCRCQSGGLVSFFDISTPSNPEQVTSILQHNAFITIPEQKGRGKMEKRKLQFDFTEEAVEELDELQRLTRLSTRVDAIRHALRFLRWAVDETRNGGVLCIERDDKIREVIPFWEQAIKTVATAGSRNGK
jgi:hypothetical protein